MKNDILLSILIPTRNRQKYAFLTIKQILSMPNENFQLVIQDNSNKDNLKTKIQKFENDKRLEYFYEKNILSFVDNFHLGIERCKGEYITIIGDDDGIIPDIMQVTEWASKKNIEAISPALPLIYFWPDSGVKAVDSVGTLRIYNFTGKVKYTNPKNELKKFLKNGCYNYLEYNLGKAYHGIVKKSVLDSIKIEHGKYVGGLTPDIYLSTSISLIAKKIAVIDYPLTISGICSRSGSSDSSTGKHTGKLESAPHFKGLKDYKWSKSVPPFYSVETIWADSALAAINDLNKIEFLKFYNANALIFRCIKKYPKFKKLIINHCNERILTKKALRGINFFFRGIVKVFIYRTNQRIINFFNKIRNSNTQKTFKNVNDIQEASFISIKNINAKKINLIDNINKLKP